MTSTWAGMPVPLRGLGLNVISQEWKNEMDRIISLGLNGYKRRKESRNDCLVQSGHAEIEGDQLLFIYGNALEVLNNQEF